MWVSSQIKWFAPYNEPVPFFVSFELLSSWCLSPISLSWITSHLREYKNISHMTFTLTQLFLYRHSKCNVLSSKQSDTQQQINVSFKTMESDELSIKRTRKAHIFDFCRDDERFIITSFIFQPLYKSINGRLKTDKKNKTRENKDGQCSVSKCLNINQVDIYSTIECWRSSSYCLQQIVSVELQQFCSVLKSKPLSKETPFLKAIKTVLRPFKPSRWRSHCRPDTSTPVSQDEQINCAQQGQEETRSSQILPALAVFSLFSLTSFLHFISSSYH